MSDSQPAQEQNAEPSNNYQQDLTEKKEASKQKTLEQIAREREEMEEEFNLIQMEIFMKGIGMMGI